MFTSTLDQPDEILAYLQKPVRAVKEALDDGVSFADTVMASSHPDPHLWAHLVRYRAHMFLTATQGDGWEMGRTLPNSGIEIVCEPFLLRALKSLNGDPPHPGGNIARRQFWSQQLRLPLWDIESDVVGANLLLDWSADRAREITLSLSKPAGTWNYRGIPRLDWRRPIVFEEVEELRFESREEDVDVQPRFEPDELEEEGGDSG